jgi:IS30 family transposase
MTRDANSNLSSKVDARPITGIARKMSVKNEAKNKHMTLDDRMEIQQCLMHGMTFKAIAARIGKDQTTVSKEVKKHLTIQEKNAKTTEKEPCPKLLRTPFVCNGCQSRRICRLQKQYYYARPAHDEYTTLLSECREGVALNKQTFWDANTNLQ